MKIIALLTLVMQFLNKLLEYIKRTETAIEHNAVIEQKEKSRSAIEAAFELKTAKEKEDEIQRIFSNTPKPK